MFAVTIACEKTVDPVIEPVEEDDTEVVNSEDFKNSIADAMANNCTDHEEAGDYSWNDTEVVRIVLAGNTIAVYGAGATADNSIVTITAAGTYNLTGSLDDGQIIVNTEDEEVVRLILNGVDIRSSSNSPVYIKKSKKTIIVLTENSQNFVTDAASYIFEDSEEDEPNAAIFSKSDLTLYGEGSLTVDGNYNDGIASKDGLILRCDTLIVNSVDDGIRGKDYLVVKEGNISLTTGGDGLKSDNSEEPAKGYVYIESGAINIISGGDAVVAETDALISYSEMILSTGGGSDVHIDENSSAKGIKAEVNTIIEDGTYTVNSADDALHSNGNLVISGGSYNISTGDDGIHADANILIGGGIIDITESYEGIESMTITINSGNIHISCDDDGINGTDGTTTGVMPGQFDVPAGNCYLYIHGGYIEVESIGDGMDINGSVEMTGGSLIVHGPTVNMNSALDYDGTFKITGGFLVAAGSSGMAQVPGNSSTQNSLLLNLNTAFEADALLHIQTITGDGILTFSPSKTFQSVAFSSAELVNGSEYDVYTGGGSTGSVSDGLYQDGTYTPGNLYTSFTVGGNVTVIGNTPFNPGGH
jgi:hypothetical protein